MILVRVSRATSRGAGRVEKFRGRERDLERARGVPTLQLELQQCRHFDVEDTGSIMRVTKMDVEICSLRFPGARQPLVLFFFCDSVTLFEGKMLLEEGRAFLDRFILHIPPAVLLYVHGPSLLCAREWRVLK